MNKNNYTNKSTLGEILMLCNSMHKLKKIKGSIKSYERTFVITIDQ